MINGAIEASRRADNKKAEALHIGQLGAAYGQFGMPDEAIKWFDAQIDLLESIDDRSGKSQALINKSFAYMEKGMPETARSMATDALEIARELKHDFLVPAALAALAKIGVSAGEHEFSSSVLPAAMRGALKIQDYSLLSSIVGDYASNASKSSLRLGIQGLEHQVEMLSELGDNYNLAAACVNLAELHMKQRSFERALVVTDRGLVAARAWGAIDAESALLSLKGEASLYMKRLDEAAECFVTSIQLTDSAGTIRGNSLLHALCGMLIIEELRSNSLACSTWESRLRDELAPKGFTEAGTADFIGHYRAKFRALTLSAESLCPCGSGSFFRQCHGM